MTGRRPFSDEPDGINTVFVLMAQYGATAIVPIDKVCRDYFWHLSPEGLIAKVNSGIIALPIIYIELSQKCAKGVHIQDLADFIDRRRGESRHHQKQING